MNLDFDKYLEQVPGNAGALCCLITGSIFGTQELKAMAIKLDNL